MKKVILIDDSSFARMQLQRKLKDLDDVEFVHAADGMQALEKILEARPDCAVLDLLMPNMNGFELLKELRRRAIDMPVVVLSADKQPLTIQRCERLGASVILHKPTGLVQIRDVVARLLGMDAAQDD